MHPKHIATVAFLGEQDKYRTKRKQQKLLHFTEPNANFWKQQHLWKWKVAQNYYATSYKANTRNKCKTIYKNNFSGYAYFSKYLIFFNKLLLDFINTKNSPQDIINTKNSPQDISCKLHWSVQIPFIVTTVILFLSFVHWLCISENTRSTFALWDTTAKKNCTILRNSFFFCRHVFLIVENTCTISMFWQCCKFFITQATFHKHFQIANLVKTFCIVYMYSCTYQILVQWHPNLVSDSRTATWNRTLLMVSSANSNTPNIFHRDLHLQ